jgi:hypothetical protein
MSVPPEVERYFNWLDEQPQRRAGGFIVGVRTTSANREFRSRPRLERCRNRLTILQHLIEKDDRGS